MIAFRTESETLFFSSLDIFIDSLLHGHLISLLLAGASACAPIPPIMIYPAIASKTVPISAIVGGVGGLVVVLLGKYI